MKTFVSMLLVCIMIVMAFTPFALADGARIWTDKDDYGPYETVTIFGEGFLPNRQVTIEIKAPDSSIDIIYAWTNGFGSFSAQYLLDGQQGTYVVTATDGTNVATTTFIDRKWFVTVSPNAATVPQGGSTTATVSVTANPPGGPEVDLWAAGQPTGVTVSFSPSKGVPPFTSIMTINVGSTVPPGTYIIYIIVFTGVPGHPSYSEKARTNFTLTVTGIPPQTVSITITSSPVTGAGFVKVDGVPITTPATFTWNVGSSHTLEALSPVAGPADTRYVWTSWSDGGAQTHTYMVPDSNQTVIAYYKTQYVITVTASPSGALGGTFKVTYTQCGTTYTNVQKTTPWTDWADASTTVTVSDPQNIVGGYRFDRYDPSSSVSMTQARTITLVYVQVGALSVSISPSTAKIKVGESVTFSSSVSGGLPPYSYQWYLNGSAVSGAISHSWTFTPTSAGYYIVYLRVTDATPQTVKSNDASVTVAPQLTVSIFPMSASIVLGQSVDFTSTVSGGYPPYSYQWFLNDAPVSGATSSSWKFTPTTSGIYYVYLKVTDSNNNIVQSATARISVTSIPVGGYSVSLVKATPASPIVAYIMLIVLFAALLSVVKRRRKSL